MSNARAGSFARPPAKVAEIVYVRRRVDWSYGLVLMATPAPTASPFSLYAPRPPAPRRWLVAVAVALVAYAALGSLAWLVTPNWNIIPEPKVAVMLIDKMTFTEKVAKPEPVVVAPAPAPEPPAPAVPAAAAPVVRPEQKVHQV